MIRLGGRLARLERELRVLTACAQCGDVGTLEVVFATPEDPEPKGTGCARCGKINVLMVLKEIDPEAIRDRRAASR